LWIDWRSRLALEEVCIATGDIVAVSDAALLDDGPAGIPKL
jgi:hypothetical protein